MASVVDQLLPDGTVVGHVDVTLSENQKNSLLVAALPGSSLTTLAGVRAVRFGDEVILKKQVTHLGHPWEAYKKRIQIPKTWLLAAEEAALRDLRIRFVGIYHHGDVTIFVDFEPTTYLRRKANNSAAHVATNDLFQAQTLGQFSRTDRNGNRLTSVRADQFADYLRHGFKSQQPQLDVFRSFNRSFLTGARIEALEAVKEMHASRWPDTFQAEWPGFFVEFRLDGYLKTQSAKPLVEYRKNKRKGEYDYDLGILGDHGLEFYGDLKASTITATESPGNDAEDLRRCIGELGRFWYVIYEHETVHSKDHGNTATIEWNQWKHSLGRAKVPFDPLSYAGRFKASVRFVKMMVLEVNQANFDLVLGEFAQGRQPGGAPRELKVKIRKKDIDNFLIYSETVA